MSDWRDALEELVQTRGRALFGYAYVLTGNRHDAEDLLQEALVRAFRGGRTATSVDAAHLYVKRAVATAFIDRARRASARPRVADNEGDLGEFLHTHAVLGDHSSRTDALLDLQRALSTLSPRERACVVLRYMEDLRVDEIASDLGIAPGTVKRYLSDAISRLRNSLPEFEFGTEEPIQVHVTNGGPS